ncbi:MAG: TIGR03364 family FAD-dependent oxidoreductase [Bacteroidia bacterium]
MQPHLSASTLIASLLMSTIQHADIGIVGAGIVGLATAYTAARQGRRVVVFERDQRPVSASIRNFGMVWPIGQPPGQALERALRSRAIWEEVATRAGFWHSEPGSLHLAYHADEWAVLEEFAATAHASGYACRLLTPAETLDRCPAARPEGLIGALWSDTELIVDPREVPTRLIAYLREALGVTFRFGVAVPSVQGARIEAPGETWTFDQVYVCSGADMQTLYPETLQATGMTLVKLQMMRTAPQPGGWRMGPALAAGLTLGHYASFAHCPSLPHLRERIATETPWLPQWGIHVMMSQNGLGELIIGDSHEYGPVHDPFLSETINDYILDYLRGFAQAPDLRIADRWYGVYAKLPQGGTHFVANPEPGVTLVNGVGGAGMTMSFGLAAEVIGQL